MQRLTTAQALARHYQPLISDGVPHETAHALVLQASAHLLTQTDFIVVSDASEQPDGSSWAPQGG